jgi:adenylate kinase family enzyme
MSQDGRTFIAMGIAPALGGKGAGTSARSVGSGARRQSLARAAGRPSARRRRKRCLLATNFGEPYACGMKRVAVFGNAGGGKSTLAKRLAHITGLPLYSVDTIKYKVGGGEVPREQYSDLLIQDEWIIDGFGCVPSAWERFFRADTLVYIDLPLMTHYWWVTKRLIKGLFVNPQGWPENSPMWRSTMSSYRVIPLCDKRLTPKYRQLVFAEAPLKRIHHLKFRSEIKSFFEAVEREYASMETGSAHSRESAEEGAI